ncbi:surfeit locus protein 6 homolog [Cimex lectularius]|uniref:Ribosomal RNA-processing protein 14/surfeit locus protein 6 C-terminal domain-containing protein n=1 Tax=Cimex lectularius TaxID=79782 RepID=A0A8I6RWP0_CIMLE|nr:surfeit locus protein 6 homolog [Cimex lectularius]
MAVKVDEEPLIAKNAEKRKTPVISKIAMKTFFLEALKRYERISRDLPDSFKRARVLDEDGMEEVELRTSSKNSKQPFPRLGNAPRAKTIKELETRLTELRGKPGYAASLIKKGLKNRLKKKMKLEELQEKKLKMAKNKSSKGNMVKPIPSTSEASEPSTSDEKPNIMFNKFDFPDSENKMNKGPKDPKAILHQIEKSKKKLKTLEERGRGETVQKIKTKQTWEQAINKVEGVKVKDDVLLLKKSIAKKKQQKNRSAKKWDARLQAVEQKKQETQKKRKENLAAKNKEKKQKKIKKAVKKGRAVL